MSDGNNDYPSGEMATAAAGSIICARGEAAAAILADLESPNLGADLMNRCSAQLYPIELLRHDRSFRLVARPLSNQYRRQIQGFRTSNAAISQFLKSESFAYEHTGHTRTTVFLDDLSNQMVAFSSIKCSSVRVESLGKIFTYPAVELVMLCVDDQYRRMGIGEAAFSYVLREISKVRELIGIQLVTLFSVKDAVDFYKRKFNFRELCQGMHALYSPSYGTCVPMFLALPVNIIK